VNLRLEVSHSRLISLLRKGLGKGLVALMFIKQR
jgi:hypothetical protein